MVLGYLEALYFLVVVSTRTLRSGAGGGAPAGAQLPDSGSQRSWKSQTSMIRSGLSAVLLVTFLTLTASCGGGEPPDGADQLHLGIDLQLGVLLSVDDVDPAQRATFLALLDRS